MNVHYNIGTYWLNGHVVGNTQQLASCLGLDCLSNAGQKQQEIAHQIGSFVSLVREGLSEMMDHPQIIRRNIGVSIKQFGDF